MENSVSQSRCRGPNFLWDDELVKLLVKILVEFQRKNGSKQAYNWKEISTTFSASCGKSEKEISTTFSASSGKSGLKDTCRNKYESMKKEYKAWNLLMNSETGLGWDDNTRRITASNEWWDRKIKEDSNCKKYRNKGMDADYEELLRSLFSGNVATGRLAMSSGMAREKSPEFVSLGIEEEIEFGTGEGESHFFRTFVDTINEGPASQSGTEAHTPTPVNMCTTEKAPMKRKRRQSVGSSKFEEHLAHTREHSEKILALFQEEVTSKDKEDESLLDEVMLMLDRFVEKGLVEDESPLWCFIISKVKGKIDMKILRKLPDDEKRVRWLKWEFENR